MISISLFLSRPLSADHSGAAAVTMTNNNMIYTAIDYDIAPKGTSILGVA